MVRRSGRHEHMYGHEREAFIAHATALHKTICNTSGTLTTSGAEYRVLAELNQAICGAIQEITGEPPVWARPATHTGTGVPK